MASLTIKEEPTAYGFSKSPILYSVLSTDYVFDDFEYIADVHVWQGDIAVAPAVYSYRLRKPRNATTGATIFNVSSLLNDYFNSMPITFSTLDDTEEMVTNLFIRFGYSYTDGSGTYQEYLNLDDSNRIRVFNGYSLYSDGVNYEAPTFLGNAADSYWMTNRPLISDVPNDTKLFMSLFYDAGAIAKVRFIINGTETVYTSLTAFSASLLVVGVGIPQLPTHTTNDDDITSYTIDAVNSSNSAISKTYTFNVIDGCKYGYKNLQYMNRFGQWDNMIFTGAKVASFTVDKSESMFSPLSLDSSSEFDLITHKGQYHNAVTNGREALQLNTGWVNEEWNDSIKQLLVSQKVFDADTLDPVTVETNSLTIQSELNDKLINYGIKVKEAYTYINTID